MSDIRAMSNITDELILVDAELRAEIERLKAALDKIYNSHPDEAADIARKALEGKP